MLMHVTGHDKSGTRPRVTTFQAPAAARITQRTCAGRSIAAARIPPASVAAGSRIGLRGARLIWAVLWVSSAYFLLQAPNRPAGALHDTVSGLAGGEPAWIAAMDRGAASAIGSSGTVVSIALAIVFLIIAAGVLVPATIRPVLTLAVLAGLVIWAVGEDFGGMLTGQGTDPSTGPLLVLLAAAFWPLSRSSQIPASPATASRGMTELGADVPSPARSVQECSTLPAGPDRPGRTASAAAAGLQVRPGSRR